MNTCKLQCFLLWVSQTIYMNSESLNIFMQINERKHLRWWEREYLEKEKLHHMFIRHTHTHTKHTHLIRGDVGHRQLGLIIQHLLKVGHVPRWVCRVPVKTLRQEDRSQGFMQFYVLGVAHASSLVWQSLEITWATWSWIPPKAIIRRVWRVICSASAPSEEARFTDQYDIKNIKFTGIQKEYHRECNCNSVQQWKTPQLGGANPWHLHIKTTFINSSSWVLYLRSFWGTFTWRRELGCITESSILLLI